MSKNYPAHITQYFDGLKQQTQEAFSIAKQAREQGYDPALEPEIQIADTMAEMVVGMVSAAAPQIIDSGIAERIMELEEEYSVLDWRVAMRIAHEVAEQKFCEFEDEREAMEVGIRIGFAYATNGVVSSPLEGFVDLELVERRDGEGKYFRINYAGPVRNAGGTAASVSVLIADYVRKHMGYAEYDPTPDEVGRCNAELYMYHERVANLQYYPSEEEIDFLLERMPVEVAGDATERYEVSNYKNLPRIPTNKLRSGYCLIYSSCIPLKAPKLWKQLVKWGNEMGMEQWNFLEEFIKIQKEQQAQGDEQEEGEKGITPNYTFIADLVAGRPVFAHPLRKGGFRLRYGRSRLSGLSGQAMHPATMVVLNEFIATGSQCKVERPGKAAAYTACDTIEGPIVRLKTGEVRRLDSRAEAKKLRKHIDKILFVGDVLVNYGDFLDRAHVLVPPGYCEEWWVQELKEAGCPVPDDLWNEPTTPVPFEEAERYSKEYGVPLHPAHTYHYKLASVEQLQRLWEAVKKAPHRDNLVLDHSDELKEVLEAIGVPHRLVQNEHLVLEGDAADAIRYCFSREQPADCEDPMEYMQAVSPVFLRDKSGTFIGARLGRPEKAKMRKLKGSPHVLFPVGEEGGRLRSFNEALDKGVVSAQFEVFYCPECEKEVVNRRCPSCDSLCEERWWSREHGLLEEPPEEQDEWYSKAKRMSVPIGEYMDFAKRRLDTRIHPDLIKGVRGTANRDHATENFLKGFLRARNDVYVNKDGTVRYDASEVPVTHFRPREIGISAAKARELGYVEDVHGDPIESADQLVEMYPQDVILPACDESPDERCDDVLVRTAQFIDELLATLYDMPPYYNASTPADLIGKLVVALAPHTSAGTIGRIIGFSKTQGLFYHPYLHCATRRDCDGDEGCVFLALDAFLNFSRRYLPSTRGGTMDAPLVLQTTIVPAEVDDMVFNMDIVWRYPLELYEAALEYKMPWDVDVTVVEDVLGTPGEFYKTGFTHDTADVNECNRCSAYKTLPSMQEKLESQMDLAAKLVAVDTADVARLVIEKHFIRDLKGNLRKFSQQTFRCVQCNEKYRRPPLRGNCRECGGRVIFTISEGSVVKYLTPAESLVKNYDLDLYLAQTIELTRRRVEEVFGKDPTKQLGLGEWF